MKLGQRLEPDLGLVLLILGALTSSREAARVPFPGGPLLRRSTWIYCSPSERRSWSVRPRKW